MAAADTNGGCSKEAAWNFDHHELKLRPVKKDEFEFVVEALRVFEGEHSSSNGNATAASPEKPLFVGMLRRGRLPEVIHKKTGQPKPGMKRVFAVGKYRVLMMKNSKLGRKTITRNFHLYELVDITQKHQWKANLTFQVHKDKKMRLVGFTVQGSRVPQLILAIRLAYLRITCGFPSEYGFQLHAPPHFLLPVDPSYVFSHIGPAHGFLDTYLAQCNLLGVSFSHDLIQFICDIDARGITDLNLDLCPGFDPKSDVSFHLEPIIGALYHNTYFRSVRLDDVPRKEAVKQVLKALLHNKTLSKVTLSHLPSGEGLTVAHCLLFRNAIINNNEHRLQILDFRGTTIASSKAAEHLATALESMRHALHSLYISECGVNGKGMREILLALCIHLGMSLGIEVLDLSRNRLDDGASKVLETWLEKIGTHSLLRKLFLSQCAGIDLTYIAKPLRNLVHLQELDLSFNKTIDDGTTQLLRTALEDTKTLRSINVRACGLSGSNAAVLLTALCTNKNLVQTKMDLSDNNITEADAELFMVALRRNCNLQTLNLGRAKFKEKGFVAIIHALADPTTANTVENLLLSNAVEAKKPVQGLNIARALLSLANPAYTSLRRLNLCGGFDKVIIPFLQGLDPASPLHELNISFNKLGDAGALALSEMLRANQGSLRALWCDRNGITLTGWQSLLSAFIYNHSLLSFAYPWRDYNKCMSALASSEKGERKRKKLSKTLLDIQRTVESNCVAVRGWFPVLQAIEGNEEEEDGGESADCYPARTDMAPTEVRPLVDVPTELQEFARRVKEEKLKGDGSVFGAEASAGMTNAGPIVDLNKSGLLMKQAHVRKKWTPRYCVLKDGDLVYWKEQVHFTEGKKPQGKIPIRGSKVVTMTAQAVTRPFCFEIHTAQRTEFLSAKDKQEMDEWMASLQAASRDPQLEGSEGMNKHETTFPSASSVSFQQSFSSPTASPSSSPAPPPSNPFDSPPQFPSPSAPPLSSSPSSPYAPPPSNSSSMYLNAQSVHFPSPPFSLSTAQQQPLPPQQQQQQQYQPHSSTGGLLSSASPSSHSQMARDQLRHSYHPSSSSSPLNPHTIVVSRPTSMAKTTDDMLMMTRTNNNKEEEDEDAPPPLPPKDWIPQQQQQQTAIIPPRTSSRRPRTPSEPLPMSSSIASSNASSPSSLTPPASHDPKASKSMPSSPKAESPSAKEQKRLQKEKEKAGKKEQKENKRRQDKQRSSSTPPLLSNNTADRLMPIPTTLTSFHKKDEDVLESLVKLAEGLENDSTASAIHHHPSHQRPSIPSSSPSSTIQNTEEQSYGYDYYYNYNEEESDEYNPAPPLPPRDPPKRPPPAVPSAFPSPSSPPSLPVPSVASTHPSSYAVASAHPSSYFIASAHPSSYFLASAHPSSYAVASAHPSSYFITAAHPSSYSVASSSSSPVPPPVASPSPSSAAPPPPPPPAPLLIHNPAKAYLPKSKVTASSPSASSTSKRQPKEAPQPEQLTLRTSLSKRVNDVITSRRTDMGMDYDSDTESSDWDSDS
ncbi:hypothetical protein QOT17_022248 [Balamuthia mandrillaris]